MNDRIKVLHLTGSPESQFFADLSLLYASGCLESACDSDRYDSLIAHVSPDRLWKFPESLDSDVIAHAKPMSFAQAMQRLEDSKIDVVVPQMFCYSGMTHFRSLFDLLGVPMVGNPSSVMSIAADKVLTRDVVSNAGVRVPDATVLRRDDLKFAGKGCVVSELSLGEFNLKLPLIVKPALADNSMGVGWVTSDAELQLAINEAFDYCDTVLIEQYIPLGREVRCGVIEKDGVLVCLPLQEYRMEGESSFIRATSSKLTQSDNGDLDLTSKHNPQSWIVDVNDPLTQRVWDAALICHQSLGCRDYSLFDFRIDCDGRTWFLEAGLYCSFSPSSIVVAMAEAANLPLTTLFDDLVKQAMQRKHGPVELDRSKATTFTAQELAGQRALSSPSS